MTQALFNTWFTISIVSFVIMAVCGVIGWGVKKLYGSDYRKAPIVFPFLATKGDIVAEWFGIASGVGGLAGAFAFFVTLL